MAAAIPVLEQAGVFRVVGRLKRVGARVWRTSNAYVFRDCIPEAENRPRTLQSKDSKIFPSAAPPKEVDFPAWRDAQIAQLGATEAEVAACRAALLSRPAVIASRLANEWAERQRLRA